MSYLKKGHEQFLRERQKIFQSMRDYRLEYPVEKMCQVLGVSKSAYYRWIDYVPSKRDGENQQLLFEIQRIYQTLLIEPFAKGNRIRG